jgi:uncharacterized membrane protein YcaP (DUF421 family)
MTLMNQSGDNPRRTSASRIGLVRDGEMLRRNMRRELITDEELGAKIRQEGIDDIALIKGLYLEGDGEISLIKQVTDETAK